MQAKLIDFTIKNNLKVPVEYGPMGNRSTAINADLLGGTKRTLKANTGTFTSNGGATMESVDSEQFPRFLFRVQGDPKLYLYEFNAQPYNKVEVVIEKGPNIKPASMFTGIKSKDIKEVPYAAQAAVPQAEKPAAQKTAQQALFSAVQAGDVSEAQKALRARANIDATGANGSTPLMLAAQSGNVPMIQALLRAGADLNAKNYKNNEMTALMFAAQAGQKDAVKALIDAGADLSAQSSDERRAINFASDLATKSILLKAEPKPARKASAAPVVPAIPQAPPLAPSSAAPAIPQAPPLEPSIPMAPPMGPVAGPGAPAVSSSASPAPRASQSRQDLLAEIQAGKTLKKASAQAPKAAADERDSLLSAIRSGVKLKKVSVAENQKILDEIASLPVKQKQQLTKLAADYGKPEDVMAETIKLSELALSPGKYSTIAEVKLSGIDLANDKLKNLLRLRAKAQAAEQAQGAASDDWET